MGAAPQWKGMGAPKWADVPVLAVADGQPVPVSVDAACSAHDPIRYAHCEISTRVGYPILVGGGNKIIERRCVLVGSGLSALKLLPEIRKRAEAGEEIIAVKGAHDWLVGNGVVPTAAIALDPQQSRAKCFKRLHPDVLYMCASQMHPDTWPYLRGHKVLVWHSRIELGQEKRVGWGKAFLVPPCSTTGNSAIALMYLLGRRNFELYGYDSSIPSVDSLGRRLLAKILGRPLKLDGTLVPKGADVIEVTVGGRTFHTTAEMVIQAMEVQPLLQRLPGIKVNAHGDGYYQALLAEGKAKGWPV